MQQDCEQERERETCTLGGLVTAILLWFWLSFWNNRVQTVDVPRAELGHEAAGRIEPGIATSRPASLCYVS